MNDKYILGFKLCVEAENFFQTPCQTYTLRAIFLQNEDCFRFTSVQYTNIASDNGLAPVRRQAIIWTNAAILSIRPYWTYFNEILFQI